VATKTKATTNRFDEDITSLYQLDPPAPKSNAYAIQVSAVLNEDEQYMLTAFHQQSVAVEGRSAMAQLVDTRIAEMATNTGYVMAGTMENVEQIEASTQVGRLSKRLQEFDNRLLDQTAKYLLATDAIAIQTMHEDIRRNIYKPPPAPPHSKRKGLFPTIGEFLFGER
jgi:hypothetical protein